MAIRKLKTCLALLAVSGVLAAAAEEAPKNLLMNSDFQTATQPGYPDFWDGASGWLPGTHALLDGGFIPETRTLRLTAKNKKEVKLFSGNFGWSPGKEGTPYTFSVYLKSEPAGLKAKIGSPRFREETVTVGGEWKRYTVSGKLDNLGGFRGRFLKPEIALLPDVDGGKLYINAPMLHRGEKETPWGKAETEKPEAQPAEPLEKSLAGFWRFDRMENNEIKDLSPKAHPAKITGAYQPAETKDGKGMLFDGNTFVTVPYTADLNIPNGEVTVELSLKPEPAKSMPVLTHGMQWGGYALQIAYGKYNPMFSAWKGVLTQPALPETVHLVMSYRKPYAEIYFNGVPEKKALLNADLKGECGKRALIIGGWEQVKDKKKGYQTFPGFKGIINYVKVYHRRVTPQEARQLYNQRLDNCK